MLKYQYPLKGLIILSSYFPMCAYPFLAESKDNASLEVPLFWGHGKRDPLIPCHWGQQSYSLLQSFKSTNSTKTTSFKEYPAMEHSACIEEQQDVLHFIGSLAA